MAGAPRGLAGERWPAGRHPSLHPSVSPWFLSSALRPTHAGGCGSGGGGGASDPGPGLPCSGLCVLPAGRSPRGCMSSTTGPAADSGTQDTDRWRAAWRRRPLRASALAAAAAVSRRRPILLPRGSGIPLRCCRLCVATPGQPASFYRGPPGPAPPPPRRKGSPALLPPSPESPPSPPPFPVIPLPTDSLAFSSC
jgi:hypothetical protein